jgi:hypothetical protein
MYRRTLLSSLALACITAGCSSINSGGTGATVTTAAVNDAQLIVAALTPLGNQIATMSGVTPALVAQIDAEVAQAEAALPVIQPGVAQAVAAPSVTTIGSVVSSVVSALQGFALPDNVKDVLAAVQTLLPLVEAAVGIAIAVAAKPGAMTPGQARAVLATAH